MALALVPLSTILSPYLLRCPHCSVGPSVKRVIQGLISSLT